MKVRPSLFVPAMLLLSWTVLRIQLASDTNSFASPAQLTRSQTPSSKNPVIVSLSEPPALVVPETTKLTISSIRQSFVVAPNRLEQASIRSGSEYRIPKKTIIPVSADFWAMNVEEELFSSFPAGQPEFDPTALPTSRVNHNPRIGGSFWTLWRNGSRPSAIAENGQVGGSQTGIRVRLPVARINQRSLLNMSARLSSPLSQSDGLEGSIGASLMLGNKVPIELIGERRFSFDKQSMARWSLTAASGVNEFKVGRQMQLDGYVQAGIVFARTKQPFLGGNAVLSRALFNKNADKYRIGIGIWGDAQEGASRVDIGPDFTVKTAVAGTPLRLSGQWRFRLVGDAQPASGPVIVLGGDF
jgi:hypothetical protein